MLAEVEPELVDFAELVKPIWPSTSRSQFTRTLIHPKNASRSRVRPIGCDATFVECGLVRVAARVGPAPYGNPFPALQYSANDQLLRRCRAGGRRVGCGLG